MKESKKAPIVKQLYSSNGDFLETVGVSTEPTDADSYKSAVGLEDTANTTEPLFAVSSVASASDNTGIAVTPTFTREKAEAIDSLSNKNVPSSSRKLS